MKCPNCGYEGDFKFCTHCGSKMEDLVEPVKENIEDTANVSNVDVSNITDTPVEENNIPVTPVVPVSYDNLSVDSQNIPVDNTQPLETQNQSAPVFYPSTEYVFPVDSDEAAKEEYLKNHDTSKDDKKKSKKGIIISLICLAVVLVGGLILLFTTCSSNKNNDNQNTKPTMPSISTNASTTPSTTVSTTVPTTESTIATTESTKETETSTEKKETTKEDEYSVDVKGAQYVREGGFYLITYTIKAKKGSTSVEDKMKVQIEMINVNDHLVYSKSYELGDCQLVDETSDGYKSFVIEVNEKDIETGGAREGTLYIRATTPDKSLEYTTTMSLDSLPLD